MSEKSGVCAGFLLPHPPIIVPAVGKGHENEATMTLSGYKKVAQSAAELRPDTVVVISPHAPLFSDYVFMYDSPVLEGSFWQFGAGHAKQRYEQDNELRNEIERLMGREGIPGGSLSQTDKLRHNISDELDYGVLVPLYYFSLQYSSFKLVAMSCSGLDMQSLYKLGMLIREAAVTTGRKVCIIASGDMSHKANEKSSYGCCPEGAQFDSLICQGVEKRDIPFLLSIDSSVREKAAECGYRSLVILCGTFDGERPDTELISYEAPFGIGYCIAKFMPSGEKAENAFSAAHKKIGREDENPYVAIARATLEEYVRHKTVPKAEDFSQYKDHPDLFNKRAGVFVSLKKFGDLRGCIGTTAPVRDCIAAEIISNAISAGTCDPRFEPVRADELDFIEYSVDVLSEAVPAVKSELDPKKYGVIVKSGRRSGLLLPDLDGVDNVEQQLEIACRKAGINPSEHYEIYKFTVERHSVREKSGE